MNFTSKLRNAVPLLNRYRCFVCQKWKHNACFSKNQLGTYTYKIAAGQSVDGVSSHLRCRLCTGGQSNELTCQRCGNTYPLDGFSKQARSNGGSKWCKSCTSWKESQEPGVTTAPAVSTDIAPDEQDMYATTATNEDDGGALSDPEAGGAYSDDDYESYNYGYPSIAGSQLETTSIADAVPYQGLGALSLSGASENRAPLGQVHMLLFPFAKLTKVNRLPSRGSAGGALSMSGASENPTEGTPFGLPMRSLAGGAGDVPTYNAYDSQGNSHQKARIPSETTSMSSNTTVAPGGWAKPIKTIGQKTITPVVVPATRRGYASDSDDEMYKNCVCLKSKSSSSFSNAELQTYKHKKLMGEDVELVTASLRCLQCTGSSAQAFQYQGRCGQVLAFGNYSKQARRIGSSSLCKSYTKSRTSCYNRPAVAADVDPDKQEVGGGLKSTNTHEDNIGALSDLEAGAGSDDEDYYGV
ncbi:hypothetical protein N431DRAFT_555829 [Stipitochalara longipes BDJ]|nr:hypothetical protein N431DRAFT_555829 [Stipitochalara longipes BDJ]